MGDAEYWEESCVVRRWLCRGWRREKSKHAPSVLEEELSGAGRDSRRSHVRYKL